MNACEVCGRTRTAQRQCRFERQCACWFGIPCGRESYGPDSWKRTNRILRFVRRT